MDANAGQASGRSSRRAGTPRWCRWPRAVSVALIAAALIHSLWRSWLCWGDLVVDSGWSLECAACVAGGKMLYRDVPYPHGPFPAYALAACFKLFGTNLSVALSVGLALTLAMAALLYRIARLFTHRAGAAAAAVVFVYVFAFGRYSINGIFNFMLPYAHSATFGIVAAAGSAYFALRHMRKGRARDFFASVLFLSVCALTKVEVLFAACAVHAVLVAGGLWLRKLSLRVHVLGYLLALAPPLAVYGYFLSQIGMDLIRKNLFVAGNLQFNQYIARHMGLASTQESLKAVGLSAAMFALAAGVTGVLARKTAGRAAREALLPGLLAALAGGLAFAFGSVGSELRVAPLAVGLGAALLVWKFWRTPAEREALWPALGLFVFASACVARLPLSASAHHYGFYLMPVALTALAVAFFRGLPSLPGRAQSTVVALGGAGLLAGIVLAHLAKSDEVLSLPVTRLETARGTINLCNHEGQGDVYREVVRTLSEAPADSRVLMAPQGVGLLFMAGLSDGYVRTPFHPVALTSPGYEDMAVEALTSTPPETIVLVSMRFPEYGLEGYGIDFGERSCAWIQERYGVWKSFGSSRNQVLLLKRKPEARGP
ncbi:MAG: glycosyltransferase family 39 protein [Planctomycetota bacterium]|nr:glycosyltransferase family 39 protein [Planctomycetota bacterium]